MTRLQGSDLLVLGFMTFALFLGAGNIIFPPSAGMAAGENIGLAALGFLLTGVGLPLLTIVALARVGGGMALLTAPLMACGEFFSGLLPLSYRLVVLVFGSFSLLVANQGLTQLISISVPVLVGLYPLAIVLVALSLLDNRWLSPRRVFVPVMTVALVFGLVDGFAAAGFSQLLPSWLGELPLAGQSLGWLLPVLITLLLASLLDRLQGKAQGALA
jgi:LIVCS family branched-chain amino acid:cation transporter